MAIKLTCLLNMYFITNLNANTEILTARVFVQNLNLLKKSLEEFVKIIFSFTLITLLPLRLMKSVVKPMVGHFIVIIIPYTPSNL